MCKNFFVAIALLVLVVFLPSCSYQAIDTQNQISQSTNDNMSASTHIDEIISDKQDDGSVGIFRLGMSKEELYKLIKERNMKIKLDETHGSEGSSIWCDNISFQINANNVLKEIYIYGNDKYNTSKGLKLGDSLDKMIELYGDNYISGLEESTTVYQYEYKTSYLNIAIEDSKVVGWGISEVK